jgi:hypothetical protein
VDKDDKEPPLEAMGSSTGPPRIWSRQSRRDRIVAEILRNRQGGHKIPTWVLAALLGLIILGFVALLIFG